MPDPLQAALSARNFGEVLEQFALLDRTNTYNASMLRAIRVYRGEILRRQRLLARERDERRPRSPSCTRCARASAARSRPRSGATAGLRAEVRRLLDARRQAELAASRRAAARAQAAEASAARRPVAVNDIGGVSAVDGAAAAAALPAPSSAGAGAVGLALGQLGTPYVPGGAAPGGFDCSGLVSWAYAQAGHPGLPHFTGALWNAGTRIASQCDLAPGDLVFFNGLDHVGMYIGGGQFVEAPHSGDVVKVSHLAAAATTSAPSASAAERRSRPTATAHATGCARRPARRRAKEDSMGLTMGTGPFGKQPAGTFNFEPDAPKHHALYLEPSPRRVRGVIGGETVVDSTDVSLLHETGYLPVWYFPRSDVRFDLLEATDHTTHCPFKGDASYWTIRAGGKVAENKVWGYPEILPGTPPITDRVAFYWDAVDHWYEEDEEVFVHPRDPYHRVDIVPSSRTVKISLDGVMLAESSRPMAVFETNLPTRWYLPKEDLVAGLRGDDAQHAPARTRAPRPTGRWAATRTSPGATRTRSRSLPPLQGSSSFYDEVVDVDIDGERQERGYSPFAKPGLDARPGREQRIAMSTAQATHTVTLERRTDIDLESYRRVAREGAGIVIGDGAAERMSAAREAFLALVESDPSAFIYGVTTSAGDGAATLLDADQRRNLARMLGRSGASFGEPLPERVVRGMVLTRLTGMIEGNSGVRPELARAVAGMLDGPLPTVPSQGNGGSGEILPLGHLFGALSARTVEDSREAMSLINGSPCASALVADAALSGRNRLALAERVCALAAEAIRTPDEQHSPLLESLWEEEHEVAALHSLRELLAGGVGSGGTSRRRSRSASCRACSAGCAARPPRPSAPRPRRSPRSATTRSSCRRARAIRWARRSPTAATTTRRRRRRWTASAWPGPTSASCSSARPSAC